MMTKLEEEEEEATHIVSCIMTALLDLSSTPTLAKISRRARFWLDLLSMISLPISAR